MHYRGRRLENRVRHLEGKDNPKAILDPRGRFIRSWNFMVAFVMLMLQIAFYSNGLNGVVIDEERKCFELPKSRIMADLVIRSVVDLIYVGHIILQFFCPYIDEDSSKQTKVIKDPWLIAKKYLSSYFLIDIFAVLPIPQVQLIVVCLRKVRRAKSSYGISIAVAVVSLCQSVIIFIRLQLQYWKKTFTRSTIRGPAKIVYAKVSCSILLYFYASLVVGAFWCSWSADRQISCWQKACEIHSGCNNDFSICSPNPGNYKFVDELCNGKTPDPTLFDFGIFLEAVQYGLVGSKSCIARTLRSFWWGMRSLSSLGQNLQTSIDIYENCFAVLVSILGLLILVINLIGASQIYMQFAVENSKEKSVKQREIELWISRNKLPDTMKMEVKENTQSILLEENQDVDTEKLLHHLSIKLQLEIKQHLCLPLLKKVPNLERQSDTLLQLICNYLKPVSYNEDSYIVRQGEPLDRLLLFTQGIAWKFTTTIRRGTVSSSQGESIENGHFIGEALLVWGYNGSSLSNLPTSPHTVKTHTKVEAFVLMAKDLEDLKTLVSVAALAII